MATNATSHESSTDQQVNASCTVSLPIVYGSIAHWLGKQANEHHTHKWSLYLHPAASPTDMSLDSVIEKVSFHLHPSFPRPVRELSSSPYQVTEMGWGEFEASIKIYWLNSSKSVTSIIHQLQLYETTAPASTDPAAPNAQQQQQQPIPNKPVINENYEEVVFTFKNPNDDPFYQKLLALTAASSGNVAVGAANKRIKIESDSAEAAAGTAATTTTDSVEQPAQNNLPWPDTHWTDEDHVKILAAAQNYVNGELNAVKDRILKADIELQELAKAQRDLDAAKAAAAAAKSKSKSSGISGSSR